MPLEYYLINAAIGVVFAIPPVVYSLVIKVKKLALLYGVFCILVTTIAGWFFGLIMCGLAMFWTYKMHSKIKDDQEKKNRIAFQKRMEEEQAVSPKIDEKRPRRPGRQFRIRLLMRRLPVSLQNGGRSRIISSYLDKL